MVREVVGGETVILETQKQYNSLYFKAVNYFWALETPNTVDTSAVNTTFWPRSRYTGQKSVNAIRWHLLTNSCFHIMCYFV